MRIAAAAIACASVLGLGSVRVMDFVVGRVSECLVSPLTSGSVDPHGYSSIAGELVASSVASSCSVLSIEVLGFSLVAWV